MIPECSFIKPGGQKCSAIALRGQSLCYFHIRPQRLRRNLSPASRVPLLLPSLDSRPAINSAITQVLDALASSRLGPQHVRLYLYGLQIARNNLDPALSKRSPAPGPTRELSTSSLSRELITDR